MRATMVFCLSGDVSWIICFKMQLISFYLQEFTVLEQAALLKEEMEWNGLDTQWATEVKAWQNTQPPPHVMIRLVLNGRFLVVVAVEQFGDSFSIWQIRKAAVLSVWWHERAEISGRRGVCVVHILPDYSAILLVSQHSLCWCLISRIQMITSWKVFYTCEHEWD